MSLTKYSKPAIEHLEISFMSVKLWIKEKGLLLWKDSSGLKDFQNKNSATNNCSGCAFSKVHVITESKNLVQSTESAICVGSLISGLLYSLYRMTFKSFLV